MLRRLSLAPPSEDREELIALLQWLVDQYSPEAVEQRERLVREYSEMKRELDRLALFIREHYRHAITRGRHRGFTGAADVAIYYMRVPWADRLRNLLREVTR